VKGDFKMKATGIIRRIDELGRVVIPKEIRRTIHVKEGDPLEIFVGDDGSVMLKKYNESANYVDEIQSIISDVKDSYSYDCKAQKEICDALNGVIEAIKNNKKDE
jgi:stage V sporulation protein T